MQNLDANQLNFCLVKNQNIPEEGPRAVPILLDFSADATLQADLSNLQRQGYLSLIQTVFVDMSQNPNTLTILANGSNQRIVCKPNTQGYYNILVPNPAKLQFSISVAGAQPIVQVFLCNSPIAGSVWATV